MEPACYRWGYPEGLLPGEGARAERAPRKCGSRTHACACGEARACETSSGEHRLSCRAAAAAASASSVAASTPGSGSWAAPKILTSYAPLTMPLPRRRPARGAAVRVARAQGGRWPRGWSPFGPQRRRPSSARARAGRRARPSESPVICLYPSRQGRLIKTWWGRAGGADP